VYLIVPSRRFLGLLSLVVVLGASLFGQRLAAQGVASSIVSKVVRIESFRFGTDPDCGVGFFVGSPGLIVTTYRTIRGAERLRVALADGRVVGDARVASYSTTSDVAVLHTTSTPIDSILEGGEANPGQLVRAWGYRNGGGSVGFRLSVAARQEGPGRHILLTGPVALCSIGGPLINADGFVIGIVGGSDHAIPISEARPAITEARSNISSGRLMSVAEVAQREHHLFGSVVLRADQLNTSARVGPLETWQWPGTAHEAELPFTFLGPMGRYEIELLASGGLLNRTTIEVKPGVAIQVTLFPGAAAAGGGSSSKLPWVLSVLGAAGAGTAAVVISGGGDGGGGPSKCCGPTGTGTIEVSVPKFPEG